MIKIAHIINPFEINKSSDLYLAQSITFETMLVARKFCSSAIEVIQLTAQYKEDRHLVPQDFIITNIGSVNLEVSSVSLTGIHASQFTITSSPGVPGTVSPAGYATVTVRFNPSNYGAKSTVIWPGLVIISEMPRTDCPSTSLIISNASIIETF